MPSADCGYSRWASEARSVPSNPLPSADSGKYEEAPSRCDATLPLATLLHLWCHYFGEADFTARTASHQREAQNACIASQQRE